MVKFVRAFGTSESVGEIFAVGKSRGNLSSRHGAVASLIRIMFSLSLFGNYVLYCSIQYLKWD